GVELDALLTAGVRPRFYPVHRDLEVDVDEVARLIGPTTAAVYIIHYAGFSAPVKALAALCRERGIRLIEDAALALLSQVDDHPPPPQLPETGGTSELGIASHQRRPAGWGMSALLPVQDQAPRAAFASGPDARGRDRRVLAGSAPDDPARRLPRGGRDPENRAV